MEEFAKMIYKKWFEEEAGNLSWGDYDKAVTKIHEILKEELAEEMGYPGKSIHCRFFIRLQMLIKWENRILRKGRT